MSSALPPTFVEGFHDEASVRKMEYQPLGKTGMKVSKISIGGGTMCSAFYGQLNEDEGIRTMREALKRGINYIDTAPYYGQGESESVIGRALQGIPRKAYYIATKTCRYDRTGPNQFDFSYERTMKSVEESLNRLQVSYIDLYQLHDVEFADNLDEVIDGALRACVDLKKKGVIKAIGINGYPLSVLKEGILKAKGQIDTVLTYARYTLMDDSLLDYLEFFKEQNVGIITASAHACGLLTNNGPPVWHPSTPEIKSVVEEAANICKSNGIELGKLAMYHTIQLDGPSTFLSGMEKMAYLDYNLGVYWNGLSDKEMEIYKKLMEGVFSKLPRDQKHWEGVEIKRYREQQKSFKK